MINATQTCCKMFVIINYLICPLQPNILQFAYYLPLRIYCCQGLLILSYFENTQLLNTLNRDENFMQQCLIGKVLKPFT